MHRCTTNNCSRISQVISKIPKTTSVGVLVGWLWAGQRKDGVWEGVEFGARHCPTKMCFGHFCRSSLEGIEASSVGPYPTSDG